jgi:hypothetical protein
MTRKELTSLASALARGYAHLHSSAERKGYHLAVAAVSQFCAASSPDFDAVRFSATIYQTNKQSK